MNRSSAFYFKEDSLKNKHLQKKSFSDAHRMVFMLFRNLSMKWKRSRDSLWRQNKFFFTKMEKRRCTNMERNLLKFVIESRKKELVIWTASSMTENRIKFDRFAVSFPCDSYWCTAPFRTISKTCNAVVLNTHHRDNDYISKASYENCYHQTLTSYTFYFILSLCLVQHPINRLRQLFINFLHLTNKSFLSKQFANIDKDYMSLFQLFRCHSMLSNFKITIINMFCCMALYVSKSSSFF